MWSRSSNGATLLLLTLLGATAVLASTWSGSTSCVEPGRALYTYPTKTGSSSWSTTEPDACCETCAEHCYIAEFTATVQNSDSFDVDVNVCNEDDDDCAVTLLMRTAPCRRCVSESEYDDTTIVDDEGTLAIHCGTSHCEISEFYAFVGTDDLDKVISVATLFGDQCTGNWHGNSVFNTFGVDDDFMLQQINDCTCVDIDASVAPSTWFSSLGSEIILVYDDYFGQPNFPNVCWAREHFAATLDSDFEGDLESLWRAYAPASGGDVWLEKPITKTLRQISCSEMTATRDKFSANLGGP